MTKWFDTNYHYIVPEFTTTTAFKLDATRLLAQLAEARAQGVKAKPVIIGPVTYLALGKAKATLNESARVGAPGFGMGCEAQSAAIPGGIASICNEADRPKPECADRDGLIQRCLKDGSDKLALLPRLLPVYAELLEMLAEQGAQWVQMDEPLLVTELSADWQHAFNTVYHHLKSSRVKLLLTTYFGALRENQYLAANLPVAGLHIDAINGREDVVPLLGLMPPHKMLSLGVINGRNIWKTDLNATPDWLEPIAGRLGERLWLAPSCSLLHVPVDLAGEHKLDAEVKSWLAFARQKLAELHVLAGALRHGRASVENALTANRAAIQARRDSPRVHHLAVKAAVAQIDARLGQRQSPYAQRAPKQAARLQLPLYPTTTIGSFPQTAEIRHARGEFRAGRLDQAAYKTAMRAEIARCVREQEALGLDVLVHGEPERNDMVEYFGEQLEGYAFSQSGWVQSYGSRCVKPPILFGDIRRPAPMTVEWITYAQSLTQKPMKGMLTGPVTILNWSFVRDDQPRALSCRQLALAIREEVLDLERAGARVIQIDEAALREGLPLRRAQWQDYLNWAVESFRIAVSGVRDETQIHTHMCYSEFNDIIAAIAQMDADVITIETSRSDMELLDVFDHFKYPNEIGPGVYDIHSPNIPAQAHIVDLMQKAARRIPPRRLWVNPDCGLKTRQWAEVIPALTHMVAAAKTLRAMG